MAINSASKNYTLNYNRVPLMKDASNISDETYTNVDFTLTKVTDKVIDIPNNKFSIQGLKRDTNFVSLIGRENQNLKYPNHLML